MCHKQSDKETVTDKHMNWHSKMTIFNTSQEIYTHPAQVSLPRPKQINLILAILASSTSRKESRRDEQKIPLHDQGWSSTKPICSSWCASSCFWNPIRTSLHPATSYKPSASIHGTCWVRTTTSSRVLLASSSSTGPTTTLPASPQRTSNLRGIPTTLPA